MQRERWSSRWGVILAVAGSAVGLGNFLRFPGLVASHGGGAFLIPYVLALFLLGLPLMWMEWTLGRFGGVRGHATGPGILESIVRWPFARTVGVIGVFGPFSILVYYTLIEAWILGFAWFSLTGDVTAAAEAGRMRDFQSAFTGSAAHPELVAGWPVAVFLGLTVAANLWVVAHGISGGIERLCRWGMPLLFLLALGLLLRAMTLSDEGRGWWDGFRFLWSADPEVLAQPKTWLRAAGQLFYTLSLGIGVILTYASYLKEEDDLAQSGLTAAGVNEFVEVILAGALVIPVAFIFFGAAGTRDAAQGNLFDIGFITMPKVFMHVPFPAAVSTVWFGLLFIAALTSSVSLAQPCLAYVEEILGCGRVRATVIFGAAQVGVLVPLALFWRQGWLAEFDFWAGTVMLIVFGLVETLLFGWVLGIDRAWDELHKGARMRVPRVFRFVCRWVTPLVLIALLVAFAWTEWTDTVLLADVTDAAERTHRWIARGTLLALFVGLALLARTAARRRS